MERFACSSFIGGKSLNAPPARSSIRAFDAALPVAVGKAVRSQAKRVLTTGYLLRLLLVLVVVVEWVRRKSVTRKPTCFKTGMCALGYGRSLLIGRPALNNSVLFPPLALSFSHSHSPFSCFCCFALSFTHTSVRLIHISCPSKDDNYSQRDGYTEGTRAADQRRHFLSPLGPAASHKTAQCTTRGRAHQNLGLLLVTMLMPKTTVRMLQ